MSEHTEIKPDIRAEASWPRRVSIFRDTPWINDALETIIEDAKKAGDLEYARCAQFALDGDFSDLDWLIAELDLLERASAEAYAIEVRTGREVDAGLIADRMRGDRA